MQNLSMCRICLASDIRLCSLARCLQDMYEKLTELTFKREDRRPLVACYICHARLRNCYWLRTSSLWSDELLTDMLSSGELVPPQVSSTNTLRVVSVLHLSLGHMLQSTECHVKEEAPEVTHDAGLDQQNAEDIKMEPQEEHDAQTADDVQCSPIEDSTDVMEREADDVESDAEDIKLEEDITIEENEPNGAYQSSLSAYNICPKIVKVVLERMVLNDTIPATGVPAVEKIDSLLVTKPDTVDKVDATLHEHRDNTVMAHYEVHKQISKTNVYSIKIGYRSKAHLECHTRTHTDEKRFPCDVCNKRFKHKHHLTRHMLIHTGEKRFQCNLCNRSFHCRDNLTQHLNTHTGEKRFLCDVCNKRFTHKYKLTRHMSIHTGEKRFQCNMCNKSFRCKYHLTQHMHTHTGKKRFQCNLCNKSYHYKDRLTQHIYTHTGEKRFTCDVCNKRFLHKNNLKRHMSIHTGEKRFQCSLCNKSFRRKKHLKQHVQTHR